MKTRRGALVSQYLEGLSRAALEEYQQFFREAARRRHGVYALYRRNKLYYVGLARDLRGRLKQHLKDRHGESWDRFSMYLTMNEDQIRELELLVLRIVKPTGNRATGKFAKAQNLRPTFSRMVRQDARDRLNELLGNERARPAKDVVLRKESGSRQPVLATYVDRPLHLRGRYKGEEFRARVRSTGVIVFAGKRYNSPSMAAVAALPKRRAVTGWWFWKYERAPGDWVRLRELRK